MVERCGYTKPIACVVQLGSAPRAPCCATSEHEDSVVEILAFEWPDVKVGALQRVDAESREASIAGHGIEESQAEEAYEHSSLATFIMAHERSTIIFTLSGSVTG